MSEVTTAVRTRRSEQHKKTKGRRPASRKRSKKSAARFPVRTVIVLALALAAAVAALLTSRTALARLRAQREEEAAAYERLVAQHPVNGTRQWIERYAAENGIEPAVVAASILNESSYNPKATSGKDARGLMQIVPDTFKQIRDALGENTTFDDMYDAETNIRYGCWYLGYLSRIFNGDPVETACAYHAGPNNVKLWIMKYAADQQNLLIEEIPNVEPLKDTRNYAGKVMDDYAIYFQHYYPDPAPV